VVRQLEVPVVLEVQFHLENLEHLVLLVLLLHLAIQEDLLVQVLGHPVVLVRLEDLEIQELLVHLVHLVFLLPESLLFL
jgi:hypothetical protein